MPFVLAVAIVAFVAWKIAQREYATRLTNAASDYQSLERQLNEYKNKLSGATPDEAKARLNALELEIARLKPKKLTPEQIRTFTGVLQAHRGAVMLISDGHEPHGRRLRHQFAPAFTEAEWEVTVGSSNDPSRTVPEGLIVMLRPEGARTISEKLVVEALDAAGVAYAVETGGSGGEEVWLTFTAPWD